MWKTLLYWVAFARIFQIRSNRHPLQITGIILKYFLSTIYILLFPRFDYGEKFWIIKYKSFTCTCGAENCRYSETTIRQTLDAYNKRLQMEDSNS